MGLEVHITKDNTYKLFSTMTDTYWNDNPLSREVVVKELIEREFRRFQEKAIEIAMTFPNDYCDKNGNIIRERGPNTQSDFLNWLIEATRYTYKEVETKFKAIKKEYGIKT